MKVIIVIYIALGLVFCLCLYELMRNADGLFLIAEKLFAKEIEEIKPAGDLFYFYFRSYPLVRISKNTIIAFYIATITLIVTILLSIILLVARKIKDDRVAKEEALYQRFKERMEREKRR